MSLRSALAELMGKHTASQTDIESELAELRIDNRIASLNREGHVAPDEVTQTLLRKAIKGEASTDEIEQLLRAPKPIPQGKAYTPPIGPAAGGDETENAIQAHMTATGQPYHVAASAVAANGGTILNGANNAG